MVWCGIVNGYLIGPYFLDGNVGRHTQSKNVNIATRQRMWLRQDGAPPHFALIVREILNLKFNERWIGRGDPFEQPPCSPDLTSPNLFLWGDIKNVDWEGLRRHLSRNFAENCRRILKMSTFVSSSQWRALRTVTPWLIVTLVAMVRSKGLTLFNHPKRERQGELTTRKHSEGNRTYYVHAVFSG